jgi:PhnB protein
VEGEQSSPRSEFPHRLGFVICSRTPDRYEKPQGISVSIGENNLGDAGRIFNALADGGTVQMEFQKTFWAAGFGMLVDRFGIPWMVNCEQST